jgi:hypothetical protein
MKNKQKRSDSVKRIEFERRIQDRVLDEKIEQSDNRRKLIDSLDPKTAAFARREFAKLGLF